MKKIFIFLIGFIMLPCSVQALSYYDSAKSYTIDSPEIQEAISEMQYEQKVQNVSPETKSQGLFHQIQKEVTFCGLPHGADA